MAAGHGAQSGYRIGRGGGVGIALRILAAIVGGYLAATAISGLTLELLRLCGAGPRVEIARSVLMASFAIHLVAAIWSFAAHTAWRAWWPLLALSGAASAGFAMTKALS